MNGSKERPVALITGASVGIGQAISVVLARAGYDIAGGSRHRSRLDPVRMMVEQECAAFMPVVGDIRHADTAGRAIEDVVSRFGRLDVVVNNAAAGFHCSAESLSENGWHATVGITLAGTWWFSQAAGRVMLEQDEGGVIVNLASVAGQQPSPMMAAYGAAKAAVISLTRSLAVEWAPKVRVSCVVPGSILTEGTAAMLGDGTEGRRKMEGRIPFGRLGQPDEVAAAVLFLAADSPPFLTGAVINVDGGGLTWQIEDGPRS